MQHTVTEDASRVFFDKDMVPISYVCYNEREPGFMVSKHMHDFFQLIYIVDGELKVRSDKNYLCHKGDFIILPPKVRHELTTSAGYKEIFIGYLKCDSPTEQHYTISCISSIQYGSLPSLYDTFKELKRWLGNLSVISENIIKNYVNLVLLLISAHLSGFQTSHFASRLSEYIDKNLEHEFSLDEVSKKLSISSSHLQRLCHQHFGMGVKTLFNKKRFSYACTLLTEANLSAKEIGEKLGFSSAANFSAFFRKHSGMTPLLYKKTNLKQTY